MRLRKQDLQPGIQYGYEPEDPAEYVEMLKEHNALQEKLLLSPPRYLTRHFQYLDGTDGPLKCLVQWLNMNPETTVLAIVGPHSKGEGYALVYQNPLYVP